jgi:hypothetical protein
MPAPFSIHQTFMLHVAWKMAIMSKKNLEIWHKVEFWGRGCKNLVAEMWGKFETLLLEIGWSLTQIWLL